ncbi:MAG: MotA/TolQ/ExbB proton channel family protein [Hallerella sp.]|uniref:Biopolymer transport protein ExbB n=1 Tax=Hallerella porci TaxID=1945871 RepID=A0ABX5LPI0_9BACT|nr:MULTISPECIES: MotA/TolQ/ExbB proton channel family protein [Hallerella]MCI5601776.1 MotA/TolQ/ExbB proton channel family protein [Hallerella sp.]PWL03173.1 biopolymer transport protein ExbB [Hallerella porci]
MKISLSKIFAITAISTGILFAQTPLGGSANGDNLVRERAELNKAKADLEEARQKRDMEVAARWNDREKANQERELFNQKYEEAKDELDRLMEERVRLEENVRVAREDLAQVKENAEAKRSEFLALSADKSILEPLNQLKDHGIPYRLPQRIENFNRTEKNMALFRDDPLKVAKTVIDLAKKELAFTREMEWNKGELVFGNKVAFGDELRLGNIFAMRASSGADSSVALMLPSAGDKGRIFSWQEMNTAEPKAEVNAAFEMAKDSAFAMIPVDVLLSTTLSSELASAEEKSFFEICKETFKSGGILMYPIAALFVLGLLLVLERLIVLSIKGATLRYRKVLDLAREGKLEEAREKAKKLHGSVGRVIKTGILKDYPDRDSAEKALEEVFAGEVPALERGLSSISVMATTAPLIGLLGTVMGMIQLFQVITMHGTSDPKLLAGGISVALITTEAGLIVAIPLQFLHTFVSNRVDAIRSRMEKAGLAVLNSRWLKG